MVFIVYCDKNIDQLFSLRRNSCLIFKSDFLKVLNKFIDFSSKSILIPLQPFCTKDKCTYKLMITSNIIKIPFISKYIGD